MEPSCEIITAEIGPRGTGYLILRSCPPELLAETFRRAADELIAQGASSIRAASTDPDCPFTEGIMAGFRLTHAHDMLRMERSLTCLPSPSGRLKLETLTRRTGRQYLTLYNEGFCNVPNAATYRGDDLERLLDEDYLAGFVLLDGRAAGVYELKLEGTPEISSIALTQAARGCGLGGELLTGAMRLLVDRGYGRCFLMVSSVNLPAYGLYLKSGFRTVSLLSRWFDVEKTG